MAWFSKKKKSCKNLGNPLYPLYSKTERNNHWWMTGALIGWDDLCVYSARAITKVRHITLKFKLGTLVILK